MISDEVGFGVILLIISVAFLSFRFHTWYATKLLYKQLSAKSKYSTYENQQYEDQGVQGTQFSKIDTDI